MSQKTVVSMLVGVALSLTAADTAAQMARISGQVLDPEGQPVAGVTVTVISPDSERFEVVKKTNKKGGVTLAFTNVEWQYEVRFEKEGYQTRAEPLPIAAGGTVEAEWILVPDGAAAADSGGAAAGGGGGSKAVRAYNEGVEAQRLGDLDAAEEKYRQAAELSPDLAAPRTALAAVASIRADWATAAAEAEAALAIDPEEVRAMQIRFDAYRNLGDEAKAAEAAAALRQVGDLDEAAARIFNEGVDAYSTGDVATAQSKIQQAIELSPDLVRPYVALAQINLAQGSPAEALAVAQAALEREPDNSAALMIAYDGARQTGDFETARQVLGRLVELEPEWVTTSLFDHAVKLFDSNQLEAATLELEFVVQADPDNPRAHFMLGMALFNSGKTDEGHAHLQRFIELAPDDPDVEIAQGLLDFKQ